MKRKYWGKWFKRTSRMTSFVKKKKKKKKKTKKTTFSKEKCKGFARNVRGKNFWRRVINSNILSNHGNSFMISKFFCTNFQKKFWKSYKKILFPLTLRAKPLHFYFEKVVFLVVFFFTKDVILLVRLNHFPQYFLFIYEKMSLPS